MLPGDVGSRWMPRKMAGMAMITIEVSIVAMVTLSVVFDSAIHLYLSLVSCTRQNLSTAKDIASEANDRGCISCTVAQSSANVKSACTRCPESTAGTQYLASSHISSNGRE